MTDETPLAERIEWWPRGNLRPNPRNVRLHGETQLQDLAESMRTVWTMPLLVTEDADAPQHGEIVAGHARFDASAIAGYDEVKVLVAEHWSEEQIERYALFDNQIALVAEWDQEALLTEIRRIRDMHGISAIGLLGWSQDALDDLLNPKPTVSHVSGSLAEAFGVPPFSVLNAVEGWWQNRKRLWLQLGIKSELGRGDAVSGNASSKTAPGGGGRLYGGRRADGSFGQANTKYSGRAKVSRPRERRGQEETG